MNPGTRTISYPDMLNTKRSLKHVEPGSAKLERAVRAAATLNREGLSTHRAHLQVELYVIALCLHVLHASREVDRAGTDRSYGRVILTSILMLGSVNLMMNSFTRFRPVLLNPPRLHL